MGEKLVPKSVAEDDDDVVVALETARVEEERGDHSEAARWLQRAASAARKQGRPERAGEVSRLAARLSGSTAPPPAFEPLPDPSQVLSDADEDFADKTIVDKLPGPSSAAAASELTPSQLPPPTFEELEVDVEEDTPPSERPLTQRPAAPRPAARAAGLGGAGSVGQRAGVRVAVRKLADGRVEARRLDTGEQAAAFEEEALLVPVRAGAKLF
jgi:hypothetical protein